MSLFNRASTGLSCSRDLCNHAIEKWPLQECPDMCRRPLQVCYARSQDHIAWTACHVQLIHLIDNIGHSECPCDCSIARQKLATSACMLSRVIGSDSTSGSAIILHSEVMRSCPDTGCMMLPIKHVMMDFDSQEGQHQ